MTSATVTSTLSDQVADAIRSVVGPELAVLHAPRFEGNEWVYLKECLDSTFVSSVGKFVDRFEADLAHYTGAKRAVAVVNGTAALQIALQLAGVKADDEVLVPTLSFIATANAVLYCGAVPHFIESEERTLGVDPIALHDYLVDATETRGETCINRATGRVIRAIVPMHTFGHPVDIDGIASVAHDFHLAVIEDAAESLGSLYHGRQTGTFGLLGTLSFNGNKTITTGGGGAILTNDEALGRRAKHLTTTAKVPHRWSFVHDEMGYNYRMPNINAALGCAQLEQLVSMIDAKRNLFLRYDAAFRDLRGVRVFHEPAGCRSNYWLQTLILEPHRESERDEILATTNDAGMITRPAWTLMHRLPMFSACPAMELPVAESLERRIVNIPSSAQLGFDGGPR